MTPRGALASPCRRAACYAAWLVAACYQWQCTAAQGASNPFCPVTYNVNDKGDSPPPRPPPPTCLELVTGASADAMTDMSKIVGTRIKTKRSCTTKRCKACTELCSKKQNGRRQLRALPGADGKFINCCDTTTVTEKKRVFVDRLESYFGKGKYDEVKAQMVALCQGLMAKVENNKSICSMPITLDTGSYPINCDQKKTGFPSKVDDAGKPYTATDLVAVMDICVTTCMHDPKQTCCGVPTKLAPKFACCREKGCCVDQKGYIGPGSTAVTPTGKPTLNSTTYQHTTKWPPTAKRPTKYRTKYPTRVRPTKKPTSRLNFTSGWLQGKRGGILGRRAQVSVSVSVTVAVEGNTAAVSVYDALLRCLQNPAKLDAMCLTGSSGH